jgi:hypothetical protein
MVSNFVTASQAQKKWYTKVLTKISQGQYKIGADSANIIVQDRETGELLEEKMAVYVRLGIRLLYRGASSRMEGQRIKRMLYNMSVKQGVKFNSPASAREISSFIAFHRLNMAEVAEPLENFKTFNEFFYRKLKPDARPNDEPQNGGRLVSGADCRMHAFESVSGECHAASQEASAQAATPQTRSSSGSRAATSRCRSCSARRSAAARRSRMARSLSSGWRRRVNLHRAGDLSLWLT